jgi:tetratricopeptide (TPR) repeat protein
MKRFRIYTRILLLVFTTALAGAAFGQDLGSSNTLFGAKKKTPPPAKKPAAKKPVSTAKKTPAKATPKPSTSAKTRSTRKPAPKKNTATAVKPAAEAAKTATRTPIRDIPAQTAANNDVSAPKPKNDIIITVGQKTSGEFSELFERAIEEGNIARDERNYVRAEGAYLRAQSLKTGDARAVYGLGNLYADQQRWEEAERAYRTAMQMDPAAPESYVALSFVLTQPIAVANLSDRYEEAEKIARRAIQIDGGNALAHDQLGVALELRGIISNETENSYRSAIRLDGGFALAYAHLGRLLSRKGLAKESSDAYLSAVRLSVDVPTMILVADVMQSQQRFQESELLLRRAIAQDPKHPTALMLLGRALTTRGVYDEAEKVLKKSAAVSPHSFVSNTLLGSLYSRQGKFDSAEKVLMQALSVVSATEMKRLAQEFEAVGDGYLRTGKNRDAARVYRQAIALDGEKASLPAKLARAQS